MNHVMRYLGYDPTTFLVNGFSVEQTGNHLSIHSQSLFDISSMGEVHKESWEIHTCFSKRVPPSRFAVEQW